jgi:hypothetical protein
MQSRPVLTLSKYPHVKLIHDNPIKFLYIMAVITQKFFALLETKDVRGAFII